MPIRTWDTRPHRPKAQALVAGAGPVGLVLAADLPTRGVPARISDNSDAVNLKTRSIVIHARALGVLDLIGPADRFVELAQPARWFRLPSPGPEQVAGRPGDQPLILAASPQRAASSDIRTCRLAAARPPGHCTSRAYIGAFRRAATAVTPS
jgi:2-polyprenyl-6-methoxyphenol hydroxylase-like FAD-dependent oxidoreductase